MALPAKGIQELYLSPTSTHYHLVISRLRHWNCFLSGFLLQLLFPYSESQKSNQGDKRCLLSQQVLQKHSMAFFSIRVKASTLTMTCKTCHNLALGVSWPRLLFVFSLFTLFWSGDLKVPRTCPLPLPGVFFPKTSLPGLCLSPVSCLLPCFAQITPVCSLVITRSLQAYICICYKLLCI